MKTFTEEEIMTYLAKWCDDNGVTLGSSADLNELFDLVGISDFIKDRHKDQPSPRKLKRRAMDKSLLMVVLSALVVSLFVIVVPFIIAPATKEPSVTTNKTVITSASTAQDCINMFFEQLSKDEGFIKSTQLPVRKP